MARTFTSASSHYLENSASAPVTAVPLSMACWFKTTTVAAGTHALVWVGDKDVSDQWFRLRRGTANCDACARDSGTERISNGPGGLTTNTWYHGAGVWNTTTSRLAYINGVAGIENTTACTPAGADRVSIGRIGRSVPADYLDGTIAEVGIWNVALTATEILALAKGALPSMIRPQSLVFYAPCWGNDSPEPDLSTGARDMTVTGATSAAHSPSSMNLYVPEHWSKTVVASAPAATVRMLASSGVGK